MKPTWSDLKWSVILPYSVIKPNLIITQTACKKHYSEQIRFLLDPWITLGNTEQILFWIYSHMLDKMKQAGGEDHIR